MTILGIILTIVAGAGAFAVCFFVTDNCDTKKGPVISVCVGILVAAIVFGVMFWYYNNTASGIRALKDFHSEINNGIYREITVTSEDGRMIFHYEGKCDIETDHIGEGYFLFEGEDGLRQIVDKGIQDTLVIKEIIEKK